jgi:hypothetical protein
MYPNLKIVGFGLGVLIPHQIALKKHKKMNQVVKRLWKLLDLFIVCSQYY